MFALMLGGVFASCSKNDHDDDIIDPEVHGKVIKIQLSTASTTSNTRSIGIKTNDNDPLAFDLSQVQVYALNSSGKMLLDDEGKPEVRTITVTENTSVTDPTAKLYDGEATVPFNTYKLAIFLNKGATDQMSVNNRQGDKNTYIVPAVGHGDIASDNTAYVHVKMKMARLQIVNDMSDFNVIAPTTPPHTVRENTNLTSNRATSEEELMSYAMMILDLMQVENVGNIDDFLSDYTGAFTVPYELLRIEAFYLNDTYLNVNEAEYIPEGGTNTASRDVTPFRTSWKTDFTSVKSGLYNTHTSTNAYADDATLGVDYGWRITPFFNGDQEPVGRKYYGVPTGFGYYSHTDPFYLEDQFSDRDEAFLPYMSYYFLELNDFLNTAMLETRFHQIDINSSFEHIGPIMDWAYGVNAKLKSSFFQNGLSGEDAGAGALGFNIYEQGVDTDTNLEADPQQPNLIVEYSYLSKLETSGFDFGRYTPEASKPMTLSSPDGDMTFEAYVPVTKYLNISAFKALKDGSTTETYYPGFKGGYVYTLKLSDIIKMIFAKAPEMTPEKQSIDVTIDVQVGQWDESEITGNPFVPEPETPTPGGDV